MYLSYPVFEDKTTSVEASRKFNVEASYELLKISGLLRHGSTVGDFMSMVNSEDLYGLTGCGFVS